MRYRIKEYRLLFWAEARIPYYIYSLTQHISINRESANTIQLTSDKSELPVQCCHYLTHPIKQKRTEEKNQVHRRQCAVLEHVLENSPRCCVNLLGTRKFSGCSGLPPPLYRVRHNFL